MNIVELLEEVEDAIHAAASWTEHEEPELARMGAKAYEAHGNDWRFQIVLWAHGCDGAAVRKDGVVVHLTRGLAALAAERIEINARQKERP